MRRHLRLTLSTGLLSLAALFFSSAAQADVASASDPNTDRARELTRQGIAFYEQHQWQQAYEAFRAAWELKPHFSILGNLAYAEFKLGKLADGAEHLRYYLTLLPADRVKERQLAEGRFVEVRAELVTLNVSVNVDAADVFLNGDKIGRSPVDHELFAAPGTVTLEARLPGYEPAKVTLTASKAEALTEKLVLTHSSPQPAPFPRLNVERRGPSSPRPETRVSRNDAPSIDKKLVLGVGLGLTGVAAGLGTFFSIKAHDSRSDERALQSGIDQKYPRGCAVAPGAGSAGCRDLDAKSHTRADAVGAARVAFIVAAGFGIATGVTYWALPDSRAPRPVASIWVTPTSGGLLIDGAL